jgi:hypothetical protein
MYDIFIPKDELEAEQGDGVAGEILKIEKA